MADPVRALLDGALKRQREFERAVFERPPATMEAFNVILGRWLELEETSTWLKSVLDEADKDEDA